MVSRLSHHIVASAPGNVAPISKISSDIVSTNY